MAFAYPQFSRVKTALGIQDDEPQKADIFGDQSLQPVQGQGQAGQSTVQGGAQTKSSAEGELGTGGAPAGTQTSSESVPEGPKPRVSGDIIRKNIGKTSNPTAIGRAQTAADDAQQKLQDEANSYLSNAQKVDTKLKSEDLDKAIAGDESAYSTAASRLAQGQAERVKRFEPETDYTIEDINELQTDAGVKGLLRRDAGEQYNAGEAAFDMQLLRRDPEFNRVRSQLLGQQNRLNREADRYVYGEGEGDKRTGSLSEQAQDLADKEFEASSKSARDYLETKDDAILDSLRSRAAEENAARAALRAKPDQAYLAGERQRVLDQMLKDAMAYDPVYGETVRHYLANPSINIADYYGVAGDVDYRDLATEADVNPFNRIMALLGRGDTLSTGRGAGGRHSIDLEGYRAAVDREVRSKYDAEIAERQAAVEAAMKAELNPFADAYSGGGGRGLEGAGGMPPPPPPSQPQSTSSPKGSHHTGTPGYGSTPDDAIVAAEKAGKQLDDSLGNPIGGLKKRWG